METAVTDRECKPGLNMHGMRTGACSDLHEQTVSSVDRQGCYLAMFVFLHGVEDHPDF